MYKIGARIIKTGLAVSVTMYICRLFNLEPALFGAVSAVVNMQPSVYLTLKTAREQIVVHILGAVVGLAFGYVLGGSPLTMGIAAVFVIALLVNLNLKSGLLMGIVATIFVLSSPAEQFLTHALGRTAVILIGLVVAMLINIVLWPPRYSHLLNKKLRACNDVAVNYFCQAVQDFISLEDQEIPVPYMQKEEANKLIKECRLLAERARNERHNTGYDYQFLDPNHWLPLAEQLIQYNDVMVDKADQIYELLPNRLERRVQHGSLPISLEFRSMLDILEKGGSTVKRVNQKLVTLVCDKSPVEPEEISENYWENLKEAIDKWHEKFTGNYYLHALIEIGVVANEIRWVSREGKKLVNGILGNKSAND